MSVHRVHRLAPTVDAVGGTLDGDASRKMSPAQIMPLPEAIAPPSDRKKPEVRIQFGSDVVSYPNVSEEPGALTLVEGAQRVPTTSLSRRTKTCTSVGSSGGRTPAGDASSRTILGDASCRTNMSKIALVDTISELNGQFDPHMGLRATCEVRSTTDEVTKQYDIQEQLGRGAFGVVMKLRRKSDGKFFALKVVEQGRLNDGRFEREFSVSRRLLHPNIVGLHELYRGGAGDLQLVMELCTGGDLFSKVSSTSITVRGFTFRGFPTWQVAAYAWQMLSGIAYLHHYRFTHRDLKLENYMLETKQDNSRLKLIDFGLARQFVKGEPLHSRVGTPSYCAPEIFSRESVGYDERVDVWSLGVCVFVMSCSSFPFGVEDTEELYRKVAKEEPEYVENEWADHPKELRALINRMLTKSGFDRPSAKQLLEDSWLSRKHCHLGCCAIS